MIGGRASPASTAAMRPTAPALAVCVCRMCGRTSRISSTTRFDRDQVVDRRDLAVELRDVPDLDPELARRRTPSSPRRARASRRRGSSRSRVVEARRQVRDVQRRPAHVQPGDHAQDADRRLGHVSRAARRRSAAGLPRARPTARSRVRSRAAETSAHESRMSPGRGVDVLLDRLAEDARRSCRRRGSRSPARRRRR